MRKARDFIFFSHKQISVLVFIKYNKSNMIFNIIITRQYIFLLGLVLLQQDSWNLLQTPPDCWELYSLSKVPVHELLPTQYNMVQENKTQY